MINDSEGEGIGFEFSYMPPDFKFHYIYLHLDTTGLLSNNIQSHIINVSGSTWSIIINHVFRFIQLIQHL